MKCLRMMLVLVAGIIALASCRKSYNCTCTIVSKDSTYKAVYPFSRSTEREARNNCALYQQQQASISRETRCSL